MAGGTAKLVVEIITDAQKASKGLDETANQFGKFGDTMSNLAAPAGIALGAITTLGAVTVGAASEMQQAMGGVDAVFGDNADTVKAWAADASTAVGLSATEYSQFAATVGAQLKNLGVPMDDVAGNTDGLIKLGADLAATYGGSTADAVSALSSALRGEADPAERYGLALNQTAVNAELAAQGLDGLEGDALTAAKAQAIMAMATEQAGGALGQFDREADTLAGQQARLNAQWADASAELGTALLPVVAAAAGMFADLAGWVKQNSSWLLPLVGIIGALAAAILVANAAMSAWSTIQAVAKGVTVAYTAVQAALNAVMAANPIGIIILAVVALVAAFIWLWNNVEGFRNFFIGAWEAIQVAIAAVANWFKSVWGSISSWFKSIWDSIVNFVVGYFLAWWTVLQFVINGIRSIVSAVTSFFRDAWNNTIDVVTNIVRTLQGVFSTVFNAIMVPINAVINAFKTVVEWIQNIINWLGKIKIPDVFGAIGDLFGAGRSVSVNASPFVAGTAGVGTARLGAGVGAYAVTGGGPTYNINVTGGLDSADTIARRIESVLRARERRTGGVTITKAVT